MQDNDTKYCVDDLIAVFGGSMDQEGKHAQKVIICKVIAVGEKDLFVQEHSERSFRRSIFKVPQSICIKLVVDAEKVIHDRVLEPSLGDLVLSIAWEKFKEDDPEKFTGILYKIFYNRGKPEKCLLLCNNEFEKVSYDNLIVLQKKS